MNKPVNTQELKEIELDERIHELLHKAASWILYAVSAVILIAIVLSFKNLPHEFSLLLGGESEGLIEFLKYMMEIVIAVEVIHVLCYHSIDSFVEVLLMAVTRELIINEMHTWELLIGVCAVGILFLIRKYLFVPKIDNHKPHSQIVEELSQTMHEER